MPSGYSFVIADDHPLFRGALREALAGIGNVAAIHEAGDFESAKALVVANEDVDLVLLDLSMPGASGLSGLISLRGIHPAVPLVVVSAHDDPVTIRRALELGASGFISKSASMEEIRDAVKSVLAGDIAAPAGIDLGVEGGEGAAQGRQVRARPRRTRPIVSAGRDGLDRRSPQCGVARSAHPRIIGYRARRPHRGLCEDPRGAGG